jgi:hypothetical protein
MMKWQETLMLTALFTAYLMTVGVVGYFIVGVFRLVFQYIVKYFKRGG